MVKRSKGLRSKSRHILRKKPRDRGLISITLYFDKKVISGLGYRLQFGIPIPIHSLQ